MNGCDPEALSLGRAAGGARRVERVPRTALREDTQIRKAVLSRAGCIVIGMMLLTGCDRGREPDGYISAVIAADASPRMVAALRETALDSFSQYSFEEVGSGASTLQVVTIMTPTMQVTGHNRSSSPTMRVFSICYVPTHVPYRRVSDAQLLQGIERAISNVDQAGRVQRHAGRLESWNGAYDLRCHS